MPAGRGMGGNKRLIQMGGNTVFKVTLNGGKKPRTGIVPGNGLMSNAAKKALGVNRGIAKSALGGRLGIVKQAGGARKGTLGGRLGGKAQQVQQMGYAGKKTRVPVPDADSADTWGHDLYYASGQSDMGEGLEPAPPSFLTAKAKASRARARNPVAKRSGLAMDTEGKAKKGRGSFTYEG